MTRDYSIDVLKFIAVIIITWSHFELQLGKYSILATGGSFGDCLFFFCSGYTLLLSKKQLNFINWYKNRINRIYPTVFAWALISCLLFSSSYNFTEILLHGGGFFVTCIMIFYVFFFPLRRLNTSLLIIVLLGYYILDYCTFFLLDYSNKDIIYRWNWSLYLIPMLLGAIIGKNKKRYSILTKNIPDYIAIITIIINAAIYYILLYLSDIQESLQLLKPLTILPQLGVVCGFYHLCNSKFSYNLYNHRIMHFLIMFIGGMCLEIYIVQPQLLMRFTMLSIFPLNIVVVFIIIVVCAYALKVLSRIWAQTFKDGIYNLKEIFKLY